MEARDDIRPIPAFLTPFWPSNLGSNGIASYVERMVGYLRARGVQPVVMSHQVGPPRPGDPTVIRLPSPPTGWRRLLGIGRQSGAWDAIAAATRASEAHGANLLQMEESHGWAARVKPLLSVPMVVRLHGPWFINGAANGRSGDDESRARIAEELKGILAADAITAPSRNVLELTREYYGVPLENGLVIPSPVPEIPAERRWRLDGADRRTIAFIGRFDRHKGGDVMIDAFARVAERRPDARLIFAGLDSGLVDDDGRSWNLPDYIAAKAPAAADRIEVLGRVPADKVAGLRLRALATVIPSRYENLPNTVLEGSAFGAPMVASDAGGIPEIVQDGESALLVPPGDPDALACALDRLLDDPSLAARLGAAAADRAWREFRPDAIITRTLEFYADVIARHAASRR
ncbi:glycosyltransferase family 4 protein [Paludisphaera sp.]|uniref:glycosyltransferase family 4 protein n=1 Tax=Paludisphaera sp. TaxID=2017432 RepID=UPI00301CF1D4